MSKVLFNLLLLILLQGKSFSQNYDLHIMYPIDSIKYGYGMEIGIELLDYSGNGEVRFILKGADHIQYDFQPDTLFESGLTVLSVNSDDANFEGEVNLEIVGIHESDSVRKTLTIKLFQENEYPQFVRGKTFLLKSIEFIKDNYPEFRHKLNEIDTCSLFCYRPFPSFDIVSHSVLLQNCWRINIQEHVMVPPYNWKKIFIWNEQYNLYFGIQIDTDGKCSFIPCKVHYYFQSINYSPLEINLSNNTIEGNNEINELIGIFSTEDNFDTLSFHYRIVNGDLPFYISNSGELRASAEFNFEKDTVINIEVLSRNELGYGIVDPFAIKVLKNAIPSGTNEINYEPVNFSVRNGNLYFTRLYDEIKVYDLTGKILLTESNAYKINLEGLKNQILIIRVLDPDTHYSMKLIY